MTSATENLLPCAHCGGKAEFQIFDKVCNVECQTCHIGTRFESLDDYERVVEAWNTRTPERGTCEYVIEDNMNESEGMGDVWFRCTNCGTCYDYLADDWLLKMPHCPKCGASVKGVR